MSNIDKQISGFKNVGLDAFFAYVGPRDIIVCNRGNWKDKSNYQSFQTRNGIEVGRFYDIPGNNSEGQYLLAENLTGGAA
ncbi:hypothetical protein XS16_004372 [Salmonella enterica subsp. enterica serovar Newport]|nr:hypothetical protein [Salmonella enterica subsp. enterica serovar Newport]EDT3087951.1 hypothetical protein [Salmonella enterica subsp. enterica serovar Newport]